MPQNKRKSTRHEESEGATLWEFDKDMPEDILSEYWRERIREEVTGKR